MFNRSSPARPGPTWPTFNGLFNAAGDGQDVLADQLHGPRPVGDLVIQVVGEANSPLLQLPDLRRRLR